MTEKDIKDYCKNCSVEPPAMRFKCPECEHNPDNENNFVKDINVPHKKNKQIEELQEQLAHKTQECEELKKQLMRKDEINTFFNSPIEGWSSDPCGICKYKDEYSRYRKALEEIERLISDDEFVRCPIDDGENCNYSTSRGILDIINKAKGEGICQ